MFYIFFGADDFSLREELDKIRAGLGDRDSLASNTTFFEGHQVRLNQLMDACMAMPFLGSHRLIIVEGLLGRFEKREKERDKGDKEERMALKKSVAFKEWVALKKRVADIPPTTVLVLVDSEIKRDNALLKELSPLASMKEFSLLKGEALGKWIEQRVKKGEGNISPQAVELLGSLVGENLWALDSEIEKLLLYTFGRGIEVRDVEAVVSHAREANVFAMVDAVVERRASVAASLLHQLLQEGETAPGLLWMITRQLRMLVMAKEVDQRRLSTSEIRVQLGLPPYASPRVIQKVIQQSRHYPVNRLEQIYRRVLETDLSIKRGVLTGELALDILVAELCA